MDAVEEIAMVAGAVAHRKVLRTVFTSSCRASLDRTAPSTSLRASFGGCPHISGSEPNRVSLEFDNFLPCFTIRPASQSARGSLFDSSWRLAPYSSFDRQHQVSGERCW